MLLAIHTYVNRRFEAFIPPTCFLADSSSKCPQKLDALMGCEVTEMDVKLLSPLCLGHVSRQPANDAFIFRGAIHWSARGTISIADESRTPARESAGENSLPWIHQPARPRTNHVRLKYRLPHAPLCAKIPEVDLTQHGWRRE